jgi:gliding motility-associated-like protein
VGNATGGDWFEPTNWYDDIASTNGVPGTTDIAIFDTGSELSVGLDWETMSIISELRIINSSIVSFYEPMGETASLSISSLLLLELGSELKLNSNGQAIYVSIYGQADIYGIVSVDVGEHKLAPYTSTANIVFYPGSSFYEGAGYIGYPFGNAHLNTVHFQDGSNYYHQGGFSPFGTTGTDNVATFAPGSYYYIGTNTGSNIYFSGKIYGNIIKETAGDIVIPSTAGGSEEFYFHNMSALNGGIYFDGTANDFIIMTGNQLESAVGTISLKGGSFSFSATETFLGGNGPISLISIGTGPFELLDMGKTLVVDRDVSISITGTANVSGTIDCRINQINLSGNLHLSGSSKLMTQRTTGVSGSISGGNLTYDPGVSFEYYGSTQQSTGLLGLPQNIVNLYIKNPVGVFMDENISVDSLFLDMGNFYIVAQELVITGDIYFTSGTLIGDQNVSKLKVNTVTASTVSIPVPVDLNQLTIVSGNGALVGAGDVNVYTFFVENGGFHLNEAAMHIYSSFNTFNGSISGSQSAGLVFESAVSEIQFANDNPLELSRLENYSNVVFTMPGDMTIHDILEIGPSNFIIGSNTLILNGTCGCSGGVFEANGMSNMHVGGSGDIALYFSPSFHTLYSMTCDRDGIVDIFTDLNVDMNLYLNQGKIKINNANLRIPSSVSVSGTNSYIITGANGRVTSGISGTPTTMTIPIGTELYYAPITLSSSGLEFTVGVIDSVYTEGYSGLAVSDTRIINHTWFVGSSDATLPYNLALAWNPEMQGADFDQANAKLFNIGTVGAVWTEVLGQNANAATVGSYSVEQISNYGLFMVSSAVNQAPVVTSPQEFSVNEHSPAGTVIGQLAVSDPDPGQTLSLQLLSAPDPNPFGLDNTLSILVRDPLLINYAVNPVYNFKMNVCDNGVPSLCAPVDIIINVNDIMEELMIANYFSPNNDNINDTWIIQGARLVPTDVKVFNNLGTLVYQSSAYQNDWNGISNGHRLPPGVYIYIVRTPNSEFKGTLTLAR